MYADYKELVGTLWRHKSTHEPYRVIYIRHDNSMGLLNEETSWVGFATNNKFSLIEAIKERQLEPRPGDRRSTRTI